MSQPEPVAIPGARLLLEQMVRLNDIQIEAVNQLRQKSRAYLGMGALAVTASAAFLAISDVHAGLAAGMAVALVLFALSAWFAVRAELSTFLEAVPDIETFSALVEGNESNWSDDQLALWAAREFADSIQPRAKHQVDWIAQRVNWQLYLFLAEVVALGGTLVAAIAT